MKNINTNKSNYKFYNVTAKCGHVGGNDKYIPISFEVAANSAQEAAAIARWIPRVKHHHKDAILSVDEITKEEYIELKETNDSDPYLKACSKQEQNLFIDVIKSRICEDDYNKKKSSVKNDDSVSKKNIYSKKQKIRKPNTWKHMFCEELG